jgi:purine-binding chemotaxis protein CheW
MVQQGGTSNQLNNQAGDFASDGSQYLTFALGQEEYGVEILKVQEIKGYTPVTPVPNTPSHIKGVMNLRGTIIPVVDLRAKLALKETDYNQFTVIIVVTVGTKVVGLIVDSVSDVLNIKKNDVQEPPDFGSTVNTDAISGMAKTGDKIVMLLDINKVLNEEDFAAVSAPSDAQPA